MSHWGIRGGPMEVRWHRWAVGWGTLAIINAGLAESKQRSRLAWCGLSLLFGPFATAFIVAMPPPHTLQHVQRAPTLAYRPQEELARA